MDNKEFNEQRHNRKKQEHRFILGIQQLWNYPLLNLIWLLFAVGVVFLVIVEKKYIANMEQLQKNQRVKLQQKHKRASL